MRENKKSYNLGMRKKGQAIVEMAIFGSILIFILGLLAQLGLRMGFQQDTMMQAFRRALTAAHKVSIGANPSPPSSIGYTYLQDKPIPEISPFLDREHSSYSASESLGVSNEGLFPETYAAAGDLPVQYFEINDLKVAYPTAAFMEVSLDFSDFSKIYRKVSDASNTDGVYQGTNPIYWRWLKIDGCDLWYDEDKQTAGYYIDNSSLQFEKPFDPYEVIETKAITAPGDTADTNRDNTTESNEYFIAPGMTVYVGGREGESDVVEIRILGFTLAEADKYDDGGVLLRDCRRVSGIQGIITKGGDSTWLDASNKEGLEFGEINEKVVNNKLTHKTTASQDTSFLDTAGSSSSSAPYENITRYIKTSDATADEIKSTFKRHVHYNWTTTK